MSERSTRSILAHAEALAARAEAYEPQDGDQERVAPEVRQRLAELKQATTYPEVEVQLTGKDGNAFAIIGTVAAALRREVGADAAQEFTEAATACGSYDELLRLAMRTVEVS